MIIFPEEHDIEDKILANTKASVLISDLSKLEKDHKVEVEQSFKDFPVVASVEIEYNKDHPDLAYFSAVLASVGLNRNGDLFTPQEMWKARNTIINTPFNNLHKEKDIIGHIYSGRCLDKEKNVITSDTHDDYFDIECDLVVYKNIFPEISDQITDGALNNSVYVSMECMLGNIAYAFENEDGTLQIVNRNKNTAFLTKYLRAYEGPGTYANRKIHRVLKDIRFCGLGNVNDPANLNSVYTKIKDTTLDNTKAFAYINNTSVINTDVEQNENEVLCIANTIKEKEKNMSLEKLTQDLEQANASLETVNKELESKKAELLVATQSVTDVTSELEGFKSKLEIATSKITEITEEKNTISAEHEAIKAELGVIKAEIKDAKDKQVIAERIQKLTDLKVNVSDERKAVIATMSEVHFNELIAWTQEVSATKAPEKIEDLKTESVLADDKDLNALANLQEDETNSKVKVAEKIVNSLISSRKRK